MPTSNNFSKTITSLAILKANWDNKKVDYIENFVPFVVHLMKERDYEVVKIDELRKDFENYYGLRLPHHPMVTILKRATRRQFIKREGGNFIPRKDRIREEDFSSVSQEQERIFNKVIEELISFVDSHFDKKIYREEAERALLSFLKDDRLELIFSVDRTPILPETKQETTWKFLVGKFIEDKRESDPTIFKFITKIAIGQILAHTILYKEPSNHAGRLESSNYYLDVGFLFHLAGADGQERKDVCEEFIKDLKEAGVHLKVFEHTLDECVGILQNCIHRLENILTIDLEKASKALKNFVIDGYRPSDVELILSRLPELLESYGIETVERPVATENTEYQIDEDRLFKVITETYKKGHALSEELEGKEFTIKRDIDSISSIFYLRKGRKPRSFKDASHVLLTSNAGLVKACSVFEKVDEGGGLTIPTCLHDVFVGTVLWLKNPAQIDKINEKKIIAEAYAALKPSDQLVKRYIEEIDKLKRLEKISEDDYYLLRSDRVAMNLLQESTLGDHESFTDETPYMILEKVKEGIQGKERKKYETEKSSHEKTRSRLEDTQLKMGKLEARISKLAKKISNFIAWLVFSIVATIVVLGAVSFVIPNFIVINLVVRIIVVLFALLSSAALLCNVSAKRIKSWVEKKVRKLLLNLLKVEKT